MSSSSLTRRRLIQRGAGIIVAGMALPAIRPAFASERLRITSTVGMIADPLSQIGGDLVEISQMMGAGVDPHLYKPSASDVSKLEQADVIFYGGLHLEGRMGDTLSHLEKSGTRTVAVSETVPEDQLLVLDGQPDPHLWFDVALWQTALSVIPTTLAELDDAHADQYTLNWDTYSSSLTELDDYVTQQAATVPEEQRVLVTAHDAFGYFGRRYGFEVRGIQGMSTATESSARDIQDTADFLTDRKIPAIFVESSIPHDTIKALQAACSSRGWEVAIGGELFSDAMGDDGTPEGTYEGMVRHNIDTIVAALTA